MDDGIVPENGTTALHSTIHTNNVREKTHLNNSESGLKVSAGVTAGEQDKETDTDPAVAAAADGADCMDASVDVCSPIAFLV